MGFTQTIVTDIDGIIVDYQKLIIKYVKEYLNMNITFEDFTTLNNIKGIPRDIDNKIFKAGFLKDTPKTYDSIKFLITLKKKGFKIILITDRPPETKEDTIEDLKEIPYDSIFFKGEKNRIDLVKETTPSFVFEDNPKYIQEYYALLQSNERRPFYRLFFPEYIYNKFLIDKLHSPFILTYNTYESVLQYLFK